MTDLVLFRQQFPQWKHCTDDVLTFWDELGECLYCAPKVCEKLAERIPMLMLAHLLTVNSVSCAELDENGDAVESGDLCCENSFITESINNGAPITSATYGPFSASFDQTGFNTQITQLSGGSPFRAWLAQTAHGRMLAMIVSRTNRGPLVAVSGVSRQSAFGDNHPMAHGRRWPGHA